MSGPQRRVGGGRYFGGSPHSSIPYHILGSQLTISSCRATSKRASSTSASRSAQLPRARAGCSAASTGFIHYNEFLAATIQQRQLDEAQLRPAFDRLDRSHTGFINLDDVTLTTGAGADMTESAAILAHFDMNGDGRISFEEFVNGMRRMGGSTRANGGLLSASPLATDGPLPNGRKKYPAAEHRHSREQHPDGTAIGRENETAVLSVAGAGETDAATVGRESSHRPPEPVPLELRSPADDVGRGRSAVEAPADSPGAAAVQDDSKVSTDSGDGGCATDVAGGQTVALGRSGDRTEAEQIVGEGPHKQSAVGNGSAGAMPGLEEGGPRIEARIEGRGCGCLVA